MTRAAEYSDNVVEFEPTEAQVSIAAKWLAKHATLSRRDPAELYEFVMREETSRKRIKIAPHQQLIMDFVVAHPKCIVRAPIGFAKTYLMTALTLWLLGTDATQRGAILGAAQNQSKKVVGAVRDYIESSDELHLTFPALRPSTRKGDRWTQAALVIDRQMGIRDASLIAAGVGGKLPGARLSWLLGDDILTYENTSSEQNRAHTLAWVISSFFTRQDAVDARMVICNVPWVAKRGPDSVGDLTYELEAEPFKLPSLTLDGFGDIEIRNTDWDSDLIRPAHVDRKEDPEGIRHRLTAHDHPRYALYAGDDPVEGWTDTHDQVPLWPEKFPLPVLEKFRETLGSFEFMRAIRCKPRDDTTSPVKIAWIEGCKDKAIRANLHRSQDVLSAGRFTAVITSCDPAFSKNKKSNKTSIFTFGILSSGERLLLENQVGRFTGPDSAERIISASQRFGSIVVVEGNAAQRWMKDLVRDRNKSVSIRTATTGQNKNDPRFGVQSIFLEIEDLLWMLPSDGVVDSRGNIVPGKCPAGVQELISDMLEYSPDRHTGDSLMSMWIGREYARRLGLLRPMDRDDDGDIAASIGAR